MKTGDKGLTCVKYFEGLYLRPYLCSGNIASIGYGHLILDKGKRLKGEEGLKRAKEILPFITEAKALEFLKEDLRKAEAEVNRIVKVPLQQHQFDALVSFVFNAGVSETLFKLVNTVPLDSVEIKEWWTNHYITSDGVKTKGLIRMRLAEYILFSENRLNLA